MLSRRGMCRASAFGLLLGAGGLRPAPAQSLDKVVRIIVGFPAGGGTDITARVLAQALAGHYASRIIVEDKPGASGRLAAEYVKTAPADGSVMLFTADSTLTLYPYSFKTLKYDPIKDFIAVAPAAKGVLTFVIGPAVPAGVKTLADFVGWCKANPTKANFATTGAGNTPHFAGVMFAREAGIALTPVHYHGGAPAMEDLLGGHVPASVNPVSEVIAAVRAGTIRALAVTGAQRTPFLPQVPTMSEQGYKVVVESLSGTFLPAGTPAKIVAALSAAMREATQAKTLIDTLAQSGTEPAYMPPAEFAAWIKARLAQWGPVVKASGFVATD